MDKQQWPSLSISLAACFSRLHRLSSLSSDLNLTSIWIADIFVEFKSLGMLEHEGAAIAICLHKTWGTAEKLVESLRRLCSLALVCSGRPHRTSGAVSLSSGHEKWKGASVIRVQPRL